MKISNVTEGYWLDKQIDFSPHTVKYYKVVFHRLVEFLGDIEFEQVTANDIRRFLDFILSEYQVSKRTLSNTWVVLSSLWTWAEKEMKVPHIIRGKVKRPKFPKMPIEPFTQDEIKRMVRVAEYTRTWETSTGRQTQSKRPTAARDTALILVLLDTGVRAQELCDLTIEHYDPQRGRLYIKHGKGGKGRFVIMGNRARKALWRYLTTRPKAKPKDALFSTKTDQHLNRDNLRNMLKKIGDNAEVSKVHPHKFRHTFAINFLRNGGNVALLKELLGHETIEMVLVYAKIADQDIDDGAKYSVSDNWRI